jgi:hypothetical protein
MQPGPLDRPPRGHWCVEESARLRRGRAAGSTKGRDSADDLEYMKELVPSPPQRGAAPCTLLGRTRVARAHACTRRRGGLTRARRARRGACVQVGAKGIPPPHAWEDAIANKLDRDIYCANLSFIGTAPLSAPFGRPSAPPAGVPRPQPQPPRCWLLR